jgi:hypothetical protein
MGNHLIRLSELLIQNDKIPNKDILLSALAEANESIKITSIPSNYLKRVKLLVLKNLYDYQQLLQEIRVIRRVMANVKEAFKVS